MAANSVLILELFQIIGEKTVAVYQMTKELNAAEERIKQLEIKVKNLLEEKL